MIRLALLLALALAAAAHASPPIDWIAAPNASAEFVHDPVFGGRVALYRAGPEDAPALVLVHGLGKGAARDWSKVIPAFAGKYRVLALDLPGFGQSDKGNHHYSPDNFARVLDALLEKQARPPYTLMGHSMGGTVALAYVAARPERVGRLVLVDTAGVLHRSVYTEFLATTGAKRALGADSPWFESVVRAIQHRVENWPVRAELELADAEVRQRVLRGDSSAISAFAMVEHDFSAALRAIRAPTLVIWGAEDLIAPVRTGQALASAIPHARLVVLDGLGHAPQIEAPGRFNPVVVDELDGRQLAALPYALPKREIGGGRVASCDGKRGAEFSGDYEKLTLDNCRDAQIAQARIGYLRAVNSTARIVNSHLRDGVDARNSRLEITGGVVGGSLMLDATGIDAAGTRFESPHAIARNSGAVPAVLRFSVSEVSSDRYTPRSLHDIVRLEPGATLLR